MGVNPSGATNLDITNRADGRLLFTLHAAVGSLGVFEIHKDGTLANLGTVAGFTAGVGFNGIAAK